ncbi:MAG: 2-polyprenyl-3-methyl-6-methoxy-1,4-benzoquinone monooxygenase [Agarilytica sp.]
MNDRNFSLIDQVITTFDNALRSLAPDANRAGRPCPGNNCDQVDLSDQERKHAAGLMRVNHAGEVCAQALYQGQSLTAKLPEVREEMEAAAEEEVDHLVWCEERLQTLNSRASVFNPLWYGLSFGIGAGAGLISDKLSLGFVAATEEQVCKHLSEHMESLPESDAKSKAIVTQMLIDEEKHGHKALEAGGYDFPAPIKAGMTLVSKAMTGLSYRI